MLDPMEIFEGAIFKYQGRVSVVTKAPLCGPYEINGAHIIHYPAKELEPIPMSMDWIDELFFPEDYIKRGNKIMWRCKAEYIIYDTETNKWSNSIGCPLDYVHTTQHSINFFMDAPWYLDPDYKDSQQTKTTTEKKEQETKNRGILNFFVKLFHKLNTWISK